MIKNISIPGIFIGLVATQVLSVILTIPFVVWALFIYGNKVMVAVLEYPLPIALAMLLSLVAVSAGGYVAMHVSDKSLINPFLIGVISLAGNFAILYALEFRYAVDYPWMLAITGILVIPAAVLGGYAYRKQIS